MMYVNHETGYTELQILWQCPLCVLSFYMPLFPYGRHFLFALKGIDNSGKTLSKAELRQLYLQEKYSWKWKQFLSRKGKRPTPLDLKLGHNNWLRQVSILRSITCDGSSVLLQCLQTCAQIHPAHPSFAGVVHPGHPGSTTSRLYHRRGPGHIPEPQTASLGSSYQVSAAPPSSFVMVALCGE